MRRVLVTIAAWDLNTLMKIVSRMAGVPARRQRAGTANSFEILNLPRIYWIRLMVS
jgi:hypothetical protein